MYQRTAGHGVLGFFVLQTRVQHRIAEHGLVWVSSFLKNECCFGLESMVSLGPNCVSWQILVLVFMDMSMGLNYMSELPLIMVFMDLESPRVQQRTDGHVDDAQGDLVPHERAAAVAAAFAADLAEVGRRPPRSGR